MFVCAFCQHDNRWQYWVHSEGFACWLLKFAVTVIIVFVIIIVVIVRCTDVINVFRVFFIQVTFNVFFKIFHVFYF